MIKQNLNGYWLMNKAGTEKSYTANVPTTMYEVLLDNKEIDDPFWGENDKITTAFSDDDYIFSRNFQVTEELIACDNIKIIFEGLDTLATIYINEIKIAVTNNMHRTYKFDIKKVLIEGTNSIKIKFSSPTKFIEKMQLKDPLWGIETTMPGYEHIRKAHHMFGWDWGPQLPDMGIWRNVEIQGINYGKIEDFYIKQDHKINSVDLTIEIENTIITSEDLLLEVKLITPEKNFIYKQEATVSFQNEILMKIDNPELWWPNGYGKQALYELEINMFKDDILIDSLKKPIGLRTLTAQRKPDIWGESFELVINGISIFAMGADYIPEDALITRPNYNKTKKLIKNCVKSNYNCLRVWGGGIYANDDFYNLCDEYGLIIWQDFMFACGVYRLTEEFKENITNELIDNIKRIRNHPCLGLWCGNNEMEWAFVDWGLPKDERLRMDYLLMYEKLIPDILAIYDSETFYWPASPSSGGGFDDPNGDNKGDVHYWSVFHGNEHYKKFRDHYFRFASEYGMQSFPDIKTINSYAPKDQQQIFGPIMENHNKCIKPMNGNIKILLNNAEEFLLSKNTKDIVYISQVFQGETIKCGVEHWRRNRGRCMGSTYWQVNDNYPVASWSSIDYYGRLKALHYYAKRFYAPVLLSAYEEGLNSHLHITNDKLDTFEGSVHWQICHIKNGILESGQLDISIKRLSAIHLIDINIEKYVDSYGKEREIYLIYKLYDKHGELMCYDTLLYTYHKYFQFEKPNINIELEEIDNNIYISLESDTLAKSVGISFEFLDVILSDNYFDLLPNTQRKILVEEIISKDTVSIKDLKKQIEITAVNTINY